MTKNWLGRYRKVLLVITLAFLGGCYTVTSRPTGGFKISTPANYEQRQDFYLWGLVGESHIDTKAVCSGESATQLQSQMTFVDGLLGLVTLGIYSPETAKIWCK